MDNIVAVIVTYNRISLLREALAAVKKQVYPLKHIIVVDNASTDGTKEWLKTQTGIELIHLEKNVGASGGFHAGLKAAIATGMEWIWVMDDDTICNADTLAELVSKIEKVVEPVGFIGSKCLWTDGSPHYMNVPAIKPSFNNKLPFNKYDQLNLLLTESSSWVSLLINANAVKTVGLPYKEFFFWSDDCEYTARITRAGYLGFYSLNSLVVHKTPQNYFPDFCRDKASNLWKHKYGFRNEFFLTKKNKGYIYYFFWLPAKVGYTTFKLFKARKTERFKFAAVLFHSAWSSVFFNPRIDRVQ